MLSDKQLVPIFEDIKTRPIPETTRGLDTRSPCIFDRRTSRTLLRLCVVRYKHGRALLRVSGWRRVCGYPWITEECAESYGIINQTGKKISEFLYSLFFTDLNFLIHFFPKVVL